MAPHPTPVVVTSIKRLRGLIKHEMSINGNNCDLNHIDVSRIRSMRSLFTGENKTFNGNISQWDVAGVQDMSWMFAQSDFTGDISKWNTHNVITMQCMFRDSQFNSDISNWDVSRVITMGSMFSNSKFNQALGTWDTSTIEKMHHMFKCSSFNQEISNCNVSKVKSFVEMFSQSVFDRDLSSWNVSKGEMFANMFNGSKFNRDISKWNMQNAHNVMTMFENSVFDKDISEWALLGNVIYFAGMFHNNTNGLRNQRMSDWIIDYYLDHDVVHSDPKWQAAFETYSAAKDLLELNPQSRSIDVRSMHASTSEVYTVDGNVFEASSSV